MPVDPFKYLKNTEDLFVKIKRIFLYSKYGYMAPTSNFFILTKIFTRDFLLAL